MDSESFLQSVHQVGPWMERLRRLSIVGPMYFSEHHMNNLVQGGAGSFQMRCHHHSRL